MLVLPKEGKAMKLCSVSQDVAKLEEVPPMRSSMGY
jgi:hypothetical protein